MSSPTRLSRSHPIKLINEGRTRCGLSDYCSFVGAKILGYFELVTFAQDVMMSLIYKDGKLKLVRSLYLVRKDFICAGDTGISPVRFINVCTHIIIIII